VFTIIHTFTGNIYSGVNVFELSGFLSAAAAIAAAEARCLDFGGSYVVVPA
jgi:hypothetical protein